MLVLSLKPGQKVRIGDATVVFVGVHGSKLRLGIGAPKSVPVIRESMSPEAKAAVLERAAR